jgi:hypothetical protein
MDFRVLNSGNLDEHLCVFRWELSRESLVNQNFSIQTRLVMFDTLLHVAETLGFMLDVIRLPPRVAEEHYLLLG